MNILIYIKIFYLIKLLNDFFNILFLLFIEMHHDGLYINFIKYHNKKIYYFIKLIYKLSIIMTSFVDNVLYKTLFEIFLTYFYLLFMIYFMINKNGNGNLNIFTISLICIIIVLFISLNYSVDK